MKKSRAKPDDRLDPVRRWFAARDWAPFPYQEEAWAAYLRGESGLISVPTGYGKTLAATMGPVAEAMRDRPQGLFLLYITPLRALTRDLSLALAGVLKDLDSGFEVEVRSGDTSSALKARQLKKPPPVLFTTPESLSLMLSYAGAREMFGNLRAVVVDEWHELIAGKRGVQTQLGLARLRAWRPEMRVWGVSATLGNLEEAAQTLVGTDEPYRLVRAKLPKEIELEAIRPPDLDSFPWAGHLGLRLLDQLLATLTPGKSTLIFTNTRSQCERWHQALVAARPDHADKIAIHHSSMDREERESIEEGLRTGEIEWVVCTSSLDLGVDFQRVEQVAQIGSAKSLARLVQRAGRSHHRPGAPSRLIFVPTNSWELIELEAARRALDSGVVEPRRALNKPFDVLVQHLVTLACGEGFTDDLVHEVRRATSYGTLTDQEFKWCVEFVRSGGATLQAYPQYKKIYRDHNEIYRIRNTMMARQHRMSIGTISGNQLIGLHLANQKRVGSIEESFVSKLKKGDVFYFSGRKLEFMFMRDVKAYCRPTTKASASVPSWAGTQFPLSESLSAFFRAEVASERESSAQELLDAQSRISRRPAANELLIEEWDSRREGRHLFIYPFGGRSVHEAWAPCGPTVWGSGKKPPSRFRSTTTV